MKKLSVLLIVALIFGISTFAAAAEDYSSTINVFRDSPVPAQYFKTAYGYAVFPTIGKAGLVIGGSYGVGQVYQGGKATGKTSVIEGSIGFQAGGKAFSEIIFFEDKSAYNEFISGNFEFDATAQAIVVTVGAEAQGGTTGVSAGASAGAKSDVQANPQYYKGTITFVHSMGGLMYELSLGGQKFSYEAI
jgi:lipid-binding SYLF domain-containing protein